MNTQQPETLTDHQREVISMHQEWCNHPMSKQLKAILEKHENNISKTIADLSMNTEVSDARIRALAVSLKAALTIKTMIFDTQSFVKHI